MPAVFKNIMNFYNKVLLIIPVLFAMFVLGCGTSKVSDRHVSYTTGEIEVVGNEPFIHLALKTDSTKIYILNCSRDVKNILMQNQGKISKIYYSEMDSTKTPSVIKVDSIKIISKEFQ